MIDFSDMPKVGRIEGVQKCLTLLHDLDKECPIIFEIGAMRCKDEAHRLGDGWFGLAAAWYCEKYNGLLYVVERDWHSYKVSEEMLSEYEGWVTHILGDGAFILATYPLNPYIIIDVLYLDSSDNPRDTHAQYMAARNRLAPDAIIMIDDVKIKGKFAVPEIKRDGWKYVGTFGRQIVFAGKDYA